MGEANTADVTGGAGVLLCDVAKGYGGLSDSTAKVEVIRGFTYSFPGRSFTAIFGPNGCGKSTLLNLIAGLVHSDAGEVLVAGKPAGVERVGYVFQDFRSSLFPWRRAIDNIAYPLSLRGATRAMARASAVGLLERFGLELPADNYPYELSGGQQQLIALARALIDGPSVLLLDEPFSALDYETRFFMQAKVAAIWELSRTTAILVSHEIDEAIYMSDVVVFLSRQPARIVGLLEVDLPRPRTLDMLESERFQQLRTRGIRFFRDGLGA